MGLETTITTCLVTGDYERLLSSVNEIQDFYDPEFSPIFEKFGYFYQMDHDDCADFAKGPDENAFTTVQIYPRSGGGNHVVIHSEFTLYSFYLTSGLGIESSLFRKYFSKFQSNRSAELKKAENWIKSQSVNVLRDPNKNFYILI